MSASPGSSGFSLLAFLTLDLGFLLSFSPLLNPECLQARAPLVGFGDPPES